jgi:hypothetical protein
MATTLTIDQAIKRFEAEAQRHRAEGRWEVGHEWQRRASEMARLGVLAKSLPVARRPSTRRRTD